MKLELFAQLSYRTGASRCSHVIVESIWTIQKFVKFRVQKSIKFLDITHDAMDAFGREPRESCNRSIFLIPHKKRLYEVSMFTNLAINIPFNPMKSPFKIIIKSSFRGPHEKSSPQR